MFKDGILCVLAADIENREAFGVSPAPAPKALKVGSIDATRS